MRLYIPMWPLAIITIVVGAEGASIASKGLSQLATANSVLTQHNLSSMSVFTHHMAAMPPPLIRKRLDTYPMANGWQLQLGTYASMLPIASAAATLERFYTGVMRRARYPTPEGHFYRLRSGQLALEFFCRQAPIPWLLVENFARTMAAGTTQGFTGRYEMYYIHIENGLTVAISLYVLL